MKQGRHRQGRLFVRIFDADKNRSAKRQILAGAELRRHCRLPEGASAVLEAAMNKLGFSARSLDKILKISRTIADLEGAQLIKKAHIIEAVQYRMLDKAAAPAVVC